MTKAQKAVLTVILSKPVNKKKIYFQFLIGQDESFLIPTTASFELT